MKNWFAVTVMAVLPVLGAATPLCVPSVAQARQLLTTDNPFGSAATLGANRTPARRDAAPAVVPRAQAALAQTPAQAVGQPRAAERTAQAATININQASASEIDQALVGIGPAKAQAIVEHRQQHGPFRSLADLDAVKGIGPATLEKNRDRVRF